MLFLQNNFSKDTLKEFKTMGEQFVSEWAKVGVNLELSKQHEFNNFKKASPKIQTYALSYLSFNLEILQQMNAAGENPKNTKLYLWRALTRLKLAPPSNFMEFIEDEDIVEIYLPSGIQVFRNERLLEIINLTIEDLLCVPWYKNTSRNWMPLLKMFRFGLNFKRGRIREITPWNIAEHLMKETCDGKISYFWIQLKYLIPLKKNGDVVALISTNRSRPAQAPS